MWTKDVLTSVRRIYKGMGFRLVHEEPHRSFGHGLGADAVKLLRGPTRRR